MTTVPTFLFGPSSFGQSLPPQNPAAILHAQGGVWVNGSEAADSTAIFVGDLLETKPGFSASLTLDGSTLLLQPESVVKFEQGQLVLDHGGVSVGTGKSFKVKVNCMTVTPASSGWTQYEVTDVTGTLLVAVKKQDVKVDRAGSAPETPGGPAAIVREGEQKSYDESNLCGHREQPTSAASRMNPKWIAGGAAGGGLLLCLALHCFGGGSQPKPSVSPYAP